MIKRLRDTQQFLRQETERVFADLVCNQCGEKLSKPVSALSAEQLLELKKDPAAAVKYCPRCTPKP